MSADHDNLLAKQAFSQWMEDLGDILALAEQATVQSQYPLAILRARIFPSLWHGQYLLYREQGKALAFINWAWLNDELSERYKHSQCYISPELWRSGEHLWFMEILGGAEHLQNLIHQLRYRIPGETLAHWHEVQNVGGHSAQLRSFKFKGHAQQ